MTIEIPELVIGSGAGFAGDRADAALPVIEALAQYDCPRFLIYEVLAERTLAIAQRLKVDNPDAGYSPWLHKYLEPALGRCLEHGIRVVANFGSANPEAAARCVKEIARQAGYDEARVAFVLGDDLTHVLNTETIRGLPCIEGTSIGSRELVAANAYMGSAGIQQALAAEADVVLVGRTTDASLVVGPVAHVCGLADDDYNDLAAATLGGHLIECGAQISGGYYADPVAKPVQGMAQIGFPLLEVFADKRLVVTKPADTGGAVTRATVIEQILYEMHDPASYLTPDVILDITAVSVEALSENRIQVRGARGRKPTHTLKATVSLDNGFLGEGEISYAGPNALQRARLAVDTLQQRLEEINTDKVGVWRIDIQGTQSVFHGTGANSASQTADKTENLPTDSEYRVRVAMHSDSRRDAERATDEVLALYCCGPAGGCGVRQCVTPRIATASVLVDCAVVEGSVFIRFVD